MSALARTRSVALTVAWRSLHNAFTNPAIIHFHRSFLGKPWAYGSTHPAKKLWTDLASQVDSSWRRTVDVQGVARGVAASKAKMSVMDVRADAMGALSLEPHGTNT